MTPSTWMSLSADTHGWEARGSDYRAVMLGGYVNAEAPEAALLCSGVAVLFKHNCPKPGLLGDLLRLWG
jgi:hypothetical protein